MGIKDQIHASDEYQAQVQQNADQGTGEQQATAAAANAGVGNGPPQTVGSALGPVLNWEKTDVEFWMQVVQVVLLYLILRELQKGGA